MPLSLADVAGTTCGHGLCLQGVGAGWPASTPGSLDDPHAAVVYEPTAEHEQRLAAAAGHLARTFADPGPLPLTARQAVLRHLLAVLLLRIAHAKEFIDRRGVLEARRLLAHGDGERGRRP